MAEIVISFTFLAEMIDRSDDVAGTFAARVIMHESHDSMHSDAMLAQKVLWVVCAWCTCKAASRRKGDSQSSLCTN
jgi:hypothetical protein